MQAEINYAQIEKELFGCSLWNGVFQPVHLCSPGTSWKQPYAARNINEETTDGCPKCLQQMMPRLQYNVSFKYQPGPQVVLTKALSWARDPQAPARFEQEHIESICSIADLNLVSASFF